MGNTWLFTKFSTRPVALKKKIQNGLNKKKVCLDRRYMTTSST
jgi:hypothetical protein